MSWKKKKMRENLPQRAVRVCLVLEERIQKNLIGERIKEERKRKRRKKERG